MAGGEQDDGAGKAKPPEVSIARLPSVDARIFGRRADTAWLDACWEEGAHVASIVAFGGVGKSALVWDWLRGMQRDGWRGAARVYGWSFYSQGTTDRMTSADEFVSAALRWFGDTDPNAGSPWDKGERLAGLVRAERTLLVLDGVEPLQWGPGAEEGKIKDPALATLVRELGAQNTGLCVLTSRLAVREVGDFAAEKCRRLDLAGLTVEAGAELLRARGVRGAEAELREAVREYGGHGLALALLGSYLEEVGEGDVRRRGEIGPLVEDERLGGHARRVMAAYERMFGSGSVEVAVLRMLGLFDRPADEGEIAALRAHPPVAGLTVALADVREHKWNKAVARLRRVGLLAAAGGQDKRLDAHPLVREHFGEEVRRAYPDAWREGHRRLYEHLKKKAKPLPSTMEEMAPLYAAVMHGCRAGRNQEALDEVWWKRIQREHEYFSRQKLGAFGSEVTVLSAFFDPPWDSLMPGLTEEDQAWVLNNAGSGLRALGRLPEAAGLLRMGIERQVAQEDWSNAAIGARNLCELLQTRGELHDALAKARECGEHARKSGDAFKRRSARINVATALHAMGLREDAAAQFEEAERMQNETAPAYPLLYSILGFLYCDLLLDQGRDADVRKRAAQTLKWAAERNEDLLSVPLDHLSLGRSHLLAVQRGTAGHLDQAFDHTKQAVEGLRRAGIQEHLPLGLLAYAALHTHTRAFDLARHDLDEALSLATRCGFRLHEADAHLGHARLCLAEVNAPAALDHLAKTRAIIEATGYHRRDEELANLEGEAREMSREREEEVSRKDRKDRKEEKRENDVFAPFAPFARDFSALSPSPTSPTAAPSPASTMTLAQPTPQRPLDLGIVVALPEELRELLALVGPYTPHHDADLDSYLFERGPYRCTATLVGDMGESQATRVTERLIALWDPGSIVVVGIAAGVHDDLRVGDVHVAPQAVAYMQDAKAAATASGGFAIVPGAPAYRADYTLLAAVRAFEFSQLEAYQRWVGDGRADLASLVPESVARGHLFADDLVRRDVRLLADGHVATGPVVGAAAAFSAWIRTHDRNVKSLEMESAAVLLAAQTRGAPKRALAIRGISDYGDDRKQALDRIGGGSLRQYAMRNAVRLLFALLDAGVWPWESATQNPR